MYACRDGSLSSPNRAAMGKTPSASAGTASSLRRKRLSRRQRLALWGFCGFFTASTLLGISFAIQEKEGETHADEIIENNISYDSSSINNDILITFSCPNGPKLFSYSLSQNVLVKDEGAISSQVNVSKVLNHRTLKLLSGEPLTYFSGAVEFMGLGSKWSRIKPGKSTIPELGGFIAAITGGFGFGYILVDRIYVDCSSSVLIKKLRTKATWEHIVDTALDKAEESCD